LAKGGSVDNSRGFLLLRRRNDVEGGGMTEKKTVLEMMGDFKFENSKFKSLRLPGGSR
jgi:hypothetical protein